VTVAGAVTVVADDASVTFGGWLPPPPPPVADTETAFDVPVIPELSVATAVNE